MISFSEIVIVISWLVLAAVAVLVIMCAYAAGWFVVRVLRVAITGILEDRRADRQ